MVLEEESHKLVTQALTYPEKESRERVQRKKCAAALQPGSGFLECLSEHGEGVISFLSWVFPSICKVKCQLLFECVIITSKSVSLEYLLVQSRA